MEAPKHNTADSVELVSSSAIDDFLAPFVKAGRRNHKSNKPSSGSRPPSRESQANRSRVVVSLFDVPPGLLTAHAGDDGSPPPSEDGPASSPASRAAAVQAGESARGLTCIRCGLSFDARPLQLAHFKTDLHMANLRRQLAGKPPLSQEQLDAAPATAGTAVSEDVGGVAADEVESSGTDSDGANAAGGEGRLEDVAEEGEVAPGTAQTAEEGDSSDVGNRRGRVRRDFSLQEGPRLTFAPAGLAWCFSASSAALGMERGDDPWERLDDLVGGEWEGGGSNRMWAVVMLQSGKFAAAVFEGQSVVCHKAFKRYTIRAKRGGSQSSYDSGGRKAQSAGATLRRYGEQALREDTRALLKQWAVPLKACRVVLTAVPKGMRTVLFEGKDAPFDRKDPRLRPVPFAVGKPIFEEVVAVHTRVTSIVFSDAATMAAAQSTAASTEPATSDGVALAKQAGKQTKTKAALARAEDRAGPAASPQGKLEAEACPPSSELMDACGRGDVEAAVALLDRLRLSGDATVGGSAHGGGAAAAAEPPPPPPPAEHAGGPPLGESQGWTAEEVMDRPDGLERLMTPLHVASAGGHVAVLAMLLERGANPLAEDVRGRVPFMLAANKETRDAFRRARAGQPGRWDWDAARVPQPLTEELEQRQKEKLKEKEKEKKRRAKLRKKAEKERAEEEARLEKEREEAKAEDRRRRGLAAAGHCDACGKQFVAKKAFSRLEFRYCSSECVNAHKRNLAADAAERRFNGGGGEQA